MPQIPWIQILDMLDCPILGLSIEQEILNKSKGTKVDNAYKMDTDLTLIYDIWGRVVKLH